MQKESFSKKVLFIGIPDMAYICLDGLNAAGVNFVGVLGPKKDHQTYATFKTFVKQLNLNFIDYENLDDVFFIEKIRRLNADIALVCSFNYKIPKILLDSVKDGFINVHPSLLPNYRGPNPYTATILNGETETGVTLHYMDEKFDTGEIVAQKKLAISPLETMGTLFNRTNILSLDMLIQTMKKYEQEPLTGTKQPNGNFPRGLNIPEEATMINYDKPAVKIERLIRALNPFLIAKTIFRGTYTKVLSAEVVEEEFNYDAPCGTIVKIEGNSFCIKTGEGLLSITSLQFGSFFVGTSKEFIQILNPRVGERFL